MCECDGAASAWNPSSVVQSSDETPAAKCPGEQEVDHCSVPFISLGMTAGRESTPTATPTKPAAPESRRLASTDHNRLGVTDPRKLEVKTHRVGFG